MKEMKTSKKINIILLAACFSFISCAVKIPNAKIENAKIHGNCAMCEKTIEDAIYKKKEAKGDWNLDSKIAIISYDSTKTNIDAILKRVALAGYDSDTYLAPDDAYNKLEQCCQYIRTNKPVGSPMDSLINDHSVNHDTVVPQETEQLSALFESYFEIKDALVMTDGNLASSKSKKLLVDISKVKMETLEEKQHIVWMNVMNDLALDAKHIAEQTNPKHQRENFATLSLTMYKLLKVSKLDIPIYYQFCPMYNEGKGAYWLSKESTIKNPYYGSQMMSCGRTVETMK